LLGERIALVPMETHGLVRGRSKNNGKEQSNPVRLFPRDWKEELK